MEPLGDSGSSNGELVRVAFVKCQAAKRVKNLLEQDQRLRRDVRIAAVADQDAVVAIPLQDPTDDPYELTLLESIQGIQGFGFYKCPYSSATLGNHTAWKVNHRPGTASEPLNLVQSGLLRAMEGFLNDNGTMHEHALDSRIECIQGLSLDFCPSKLEVFGDDRTVVLPQKAFVDCITLHTLLCTSALSQTTQTSIDTFQTNYLWSTLARIYASHRVVRRGDIDPNSRTRQSGVTLLWTSHAASSDDAAVTGPGSPTWITVTEQGIRQSFDLTRVMFSRGNISEKIRFGKSLVQPNDVVLDMYAGIGYFTLPALIHGRAKHVYCCEWNVDAVQALRFNLIDNGVQDLATVLVGDCRILVDETALHGRMDRVSLGLLPSSEGGWPTAVKALNNVSGGWLHVHGNVPVLEVQTWSLWLTGKMRDSMGAHQIQAVTNDWIVVTEHVEKVKSFAPNVNHYVADVYIGPRARYGSFCPKGPPLDASAAVRIAGDYIVLSRDAPADPPSCALSEDGILHQAWMRN